MLKTFSLILLFLSIGSAQILDNYGKRGPLPKDQRIEVAKFQVALHLVNDDLDDAQREFLL